MDLIRFMVAHADDIFSALVQHMKITGIAVAFAVLIGVPIGLWISKKQNIAGFVLGVANIMQTIPSLALFGLIIPIMGIGFKPSVFVLLLYALMPIIKNTYIGITTVDPAVIEAGRGMGMTRMQILKMIEVPLSLPMIMGGIRISTVINIGTATIAALIGAGGLGDFIFRGISMADNQMILTGAIPTALLALFMDSLLNFVEIKLTPKGMKGEE
jgi:osmoprotectant transport system permease protein